MESITLPEKVAYLSDLITEEIEYLTPFVVIDPHNVVTIESLITYPYLTIDLATTKAGELPSCISKIKALKSGIVLFKNIDCIRSRKDRDNWKSIIIMGLKSERGHFIIDTKEANCGIMDYYLSFEKIKVVCTCSKYPDYLKERGNLGWIGLDFP